MSADLLQQNGVIAPVMRSPNTRPHYSKASTQAAHLQQLIMELVSTDKLKPAELAGLARAWCDVQEERRKLAMRPLPRSVDVSKFQKRRRQVSAGPMEPGERPPLN
jgi:hypothetical protein